MTKHLRRSGSAQRAIANPHIGGLLRYAADRLTGKRPSRRGRPPHTLPDPHAVRLGLRVLRWHIVLDGRYRLAGGAHKGPKRWQELSAASRRRLAKCGITGPASPRDAALAVVEHEKGIVAETLRRHVRTAAEACGFDLRTLAGVPSAPPITRFLKRLY